MAITRVQTISASATNVSSLNAVFSSGPVTAGNTLILHAVVGFDGVTQSTLVPTDNVNANAWSTAAYARNSISTTMGSVGLFYRTNISSGAAASTYRVRFDAFGVNDDPAMTVYEYSGIASFDQVNSTFGTSSSPGGASQTAVSVSALFSAFAATGTASTNTFRSTGGGGVTVVTTLRNGGAGPNFASGELITSSLTEQPLFRIAASSLWLAQTAVFLASTSGAVASAYRDSFTMLGLT